MRYFAALSGLSVQFLLCIAQQNIAQQNIAQHNFNPGPCYNAQANLSATFTNISSRLDARTLRGGHYLYPQAAVDFIPSSIDAEINVCSDTLPTPARGSDVLKTHCQALQECLTKHPGYWSVADYDNGRYIQLASAGNCSFHVSQRGSGEKSHGEQPSLAIGSKDVVEYLDRAMGAFPDTETMRTTGGTGKCNSDFALWRVAYTSEGGHLSAAMGIAVNIWLTIGVYVAWDNILYEG